MGHEPSFAISPSSINHLTCQAAKLIARMDQGHGLVDRILLATPIAFRPSLTEMDAATDQ